MKFNRKDSQSYSKQFCNESSCNDNFEISQKTTAIEKCKVAMEMYIIFGKYTSFFLIGKYSLMVMGTSKN